MWATCGDPGPLHSQFRGHKGQRSCLSLLGTFNLDLLVDIKIAPLARLLLYTILDNGELVVHSADFPVEPCFANKNSLCAIHAVDESVFLLKPEAELSPRTNLEDPDTNPCIPPKKIIVDGIRYQTDTYSYGEGDAYAVLKDIGFKPFTSTQIYKPNICYSPHYYSAGGFRGPERSSSPMAESLIMGDALEDAVETTVRSFFPETWIWSLKSLGAGAFCLSPAVGFGLAQTTFLKAIQPFFVEVTQPYSVIRGEAYVLKATVYNYQKHSIQVSVSLLLSPDYDASPVDQEQASYCLPVDGRKTVSWKVTPKTLAEALKSTQLCGNEIPEVPAKGQRDIVIKTLLVEPEGIQKEVVINKLLCGAKDNQPTAISLKVPENVVEKSARATFCVLGSAIQNVHQLLQLPTGCGEQNIALLAPNIYIMDYLNKTDQLTEETKSKAIGYLVAAPSGKETTSLGMSVLFSNEEIHPCGGTTPGGVDNEIALSVYIAISLLEIPLPVTTASQRKDLPTYTQALLAYAFALANKEDKVAEILQSLQEKAVKGDDGSIHWERPVKPETSQSYYYEPRAPPAEVEMSSYVLLAYLTRASTPSQDDLAMATKIVTWLIKQQNPFGGFSSTQTTASTTVTLKSGGNNLREFHVDNTNRLLLQCQALPNVPGEYTPVVTGENCIYLQTTLRYNVLPHPEAAPFELIVSTIPDTCVGVKAHKEFDIAVNVSYTGHRPASNMAILKIKIVSGFSPNKPSVKKLQNQAPIQRVDVTADSVDLYFEKLTNATLHFSFTVERSIEIQNQRPAYAKMNRQWLHIGPPAVQLMLGMCEEQNSSPPSQSVPLLLPLRRKQEAENSQPKTQEEESGAFWPQGIRDTPLASPSLHLGLEKQTSGIYCLLSSLMVERTKQINKCLDSISCASNPFLTIETGSLQIFKVENATSPEVLRLEEFV
ncbi:hypothetical protein E2320_014418 [Naja naja]|nr:hypothetical protein E2320_014418 [Naja naja]